MQDWERVAELLRSGNTAEQMVQLGYEREFVYTVLRTISPALSHTPDLPLEITYQLDQARYLPDQQASLTVTIRNTGQVAFHVAELGAQPEWLPAQNWYSAKINCPLAPGEAISQRFGIWIPQLRFGKKTVNIGVVGGESGSADVRSTLWNWYHIPLLVQRPLRNYKIFLSHSVRDLHVVAELAEYLDNHGITPVIAEDVETPGAWLPEKFANMISESNLLVALLTHNSVRSDWVHREVRYALRVNKPRILLRDISLEGTQTGFEDIEWTDVDFSRGVEHLFDRLMTALDRTQSSRSGFPTWVGPLLISGLIATGLALASKKDT